jgi:molybdopterin guanine dinucleotide-containing S/N-oxide reductase-like protein
LRSISEFNYFDIRSNNKEGFMATKKLGKSDVLGEKTVYRTVGLSGTVSGGAEGVADVKDGKILRIRPLHYDEKYRREDLNPWKFEKNNKTLEPNWKSLPPPFSLAYKKRVYSPNRIKYPLKRVDWDPNGERHPENRGKSKYQRISWDEATNIIASELKRVRAKYGPFSILTQGDGHGENKLVQGCHGMPGLLLRKLGGGWTQQIRNADSWEGWYYGAMHVWGTGLCGHLLPADNIVKDITENSELLLVWGGDPETTPWGFRGQMASRISYFWSDIGIKQVYICPELNYGAAVHADKWIPVLPNTDVALQLAITYLWITEGTFDKEYVKTHTVGFDKFADYVMGKEDGVPKTPAWASPKCGVSEWTIKAVAREFASKATSIVHYFGGGYIRGAFSHEPARMEGVLLAMQGLGKPGVHQCIISYLGMPRAVTPPGNVFTWVNMGSEKAFENRILMSHCHGARVSQKQFFPKTLFKEAVLNPPVTFWGTSENFAEVENQFTKYTYPNPKEEGGNSGIHMIWCDNPCLTTCWNEGMKTVEAYRSPKIECVVMQHAWFENDCFYSDLLLPVSTHYELDDISSNFAMGVQFQSVLLCDKAIEPIAESKSDLQIVYEVAKKMGLYEAVSEGKSIEDWRKYTYNGFGMMPVMTWEDFKDKQYYLFPPAKDWQKDPPGLRRFYENPEKYPLKTPSGKLEIYSERLAKNFPDDKERQPIPKWIESSKTHDERISSKRAKKYPLLMMSNHGRWRVHAQCDDISWTREAPTCKVVGPDGYKYEPCWINTQLAATKGIKSGDIVKAYNERGTVLGGAYVTERIMPGVVYMDHGARVDWIDPGKLDRGGAINLIAPEGIVSEHCPGMATSGYLVQVEKVTTAEMEEWKRKYPEAFSREYDPASGLRFDAWIVGGNK